MQPDQTHRTQRREHRHGFAPQSVEEGRILLRLGDYFKVETMLERIEKCINYLNAHEYYEMAIDLQLHNSWLGGEKIEGVKFIHNSYVEVVAGEHKGATGSVVSLVRLGSDARYIIEKESGFDIEVAESEIAEKNS